MTRRGVVAVIAAAVALLLALNALVYSLYRSEVAAVNGALDDRLVALGTTAAAWLTTGARDAETVLVTLVEQNRLEDAYIIEPSLRVRAGVRTRADSSLNLLRVDADRLSAALAGRRSVGDGYSIASARVGAGYFPFSHDGTRAVLALEAGTEYHAPAARLRATYLVAVALTLLVAIVFTVGLGLALRAFERARLAYGRAERLAAVGAMAAMVAHEVRNPLGILRGQVELARERLAPETAARERERFGEMIVEIDRLNRLTEEFLGLARDVPLEVADVDLAALANAVVEEARIDAHGVGATIEARVSGESLHVPADANKLRQALLNLILNAVQVGGAGVTVTVSVRASDDRVCITVADDGPGVPVALAPQLFEPFVTARPGGTGLGLAVARRVAERHGGALALESTPGEAGARFSIYLPSRQP